MAAKAAIHDNHPQTQSQWRQIVWQHPVWSSKPPSLRLVVDGRLRGDDEKGEYWFQRIVLRFLDFLTSVV
jgi:hypothetical protein